MVGNKNDLDDERMVPVAEGKKFAANIKAQFAEVSAKNNGAVTDLFNSLILNIEKRYDDGSTTDRQNNKCILS